jgi:hypothetical protein
VPLAAARLTASRSRPAFTAFLGTRLGHGYCDLRAWLRRSAHGRNTCAITSPITPMPNQTQVLTALLGTHLRQDRPDPQYALIIGVGSACSVCFHGGGCRLTLAYSDMAAHISRASVRIARKPTPIIGNGQPSAYRHPLATARRRIEASAAEAGGVESPVASTARPPQLVVLRGRGRADEGGPPAACALEVVRKVLTTSLVYCSSSVSWCSGLRGSGTASVVGVGIA